MGKRSPQVDAYIAKSAPFAQPILEAIREAYHAASPDVEETMKWGAPFFEYNGILGNMAAFKAHVRWGFWKAKLMADPLGILDPMGDTTTMSATKTVDVAQLPAKKVLVQYIREAIRLNEEGVKAERAPVKRNTAPVEVPDDLAAALKKNKKAQATFDAFAPSHRREYIEWITEAKQEATRKKRLDQTIEWLAEGKSRNWKYERK
ncbi:MAG TPA: YdeI/OmpD-associated family protein [Thermoanaerobaculia bacterium]|nr:YdeI/OmpD-associated family protein [Thermoanaerobaculia bacterium]